MNLISVNDPTSIEQTFTVLKNGGVIVYPTETAYGLGVDATNPHAVEKIFSIKMREEGKPVPVIVGSLEQAHRHVAFSEIAEKLAVQYWPGPLTLVLPTVNDALAHILRGETESGVRVSGSVWCRTLAQKLDHPITSTSANASGTPPEYSIEGVQKSLGSKAGDIDLWVDGGVLSGGPVSTIVRLIDGFEVQREGAISRADIEKVLQ